MEIFIEAVFDVIHKSIHILFSPSEAFGTLFRMFSSHERRVLVDNDVVEDTTVYSAPADRNTSFRSSLNTDARTCQDVITELGYRKDFRLHQCFLFQDLACPINDMYF